MLWTKSFIPTLKEAPQEAESQSHILLLRAGLVRMLMAGAYSYLPVGLRVLNKIQNIIREEMDSCGAAQVLLPALQPIDLWQKSGRDKVIADVMIRFTDRRGRKIGLGPTHEEVITDLVSSHVSSYKQLPLILYQIQTKFRDEMRPRFGLVRACEFIMKDAYSFDKDEAGLDASYASMLAAYKRIFKRLGLNVLVTEADSGVMGGNVSHEFMVPALEGEDIVSVCESCQAVVNKEQDEDGKCPKCKTVLIQQHCIEVGHIFKLGTKYSSSLHAEFLDAQGKLTPIVMGCYGIGVSRLISAVIEQNRDKDGIRWPIEVAPFQAMIIPLDVTNSQIKDAAGALYAELSRNSVEVLLDDRDERAGVKFKDADLLGIPLQIVIGKEFLASGRFEIKDRLLNQKSSASSEEIINRFKRG